MTQPPGDPRTALEQALGVARLAAGSGEDLERLRARLELQLAAEPFASAASSAQRSLLAGSKLWIAVGAVLVVGAGSLWLQRTAAPTSGRTLEPGQVRPFEPDTTLPTGPRTTPLPPPAGRDPIAGNPSAPASSANEPPALRLRTAARAHTSAPTVESRRTPRASEPASSTPPPAAAADPNAEVALIARAHDAIDRNPRAALGLLAQHEQQFPRGLLSEERDTLRIDAERALGLDELAIGHARAFVRQYAASAQRRRLEQWLAGRDSSTAPLDRTHKKATQKLPTP